MQGICCLKSKCDVLNRKAIDIQSIMVKQLISHERLLQSVENEGATVRSVQNVLPDYHRRAGVAGNIFKLNLPALSSCTEKTIAGFSASSV